MNFSKHCTNRCFRHYIFKQKQKLRRLSASQTLPQTLISSARPYGWFLPDGFLSFLSGKRGSMLLFHQL